MQSITRIEGRVLPVPGGNIDTDRIIPARFLRTVSFEGLDRHAFEDDRAAWAARGEMHPFDDPRFTGASILLVNDNFGCGSSREHAPQALYRRGLRAAIGESFSEIFFGNALMMGMPCVTAAKEHVLMLQQLIASAPETAVAIDIEQNVCEISGATDVLGRFTIQLPPNAREAFLSGGWNATASLLADRGAIDRTAANLPYLNW